MSAWSLPVTVEVCGEIFTIRSDFRAVLDALSALADPELNPVEQRLACLEILFPDWGRLPDIAEAFIAAMRFVNLGRDPEDEKAPQPQLVDWEKDVGLIAPAVDKVLGFSCRQVPYLHWWEFVGAYSNIGEGLCTSVLSIRSKRAHGKKLTKEEREFIRANPELVSTTKKLTDEEEEFFNRLGV